MSGCIRIHLSLRAELRCPAAVRQPGYLPAKQEAIRLCAPASRRVCPSRSAHTDVHTLLRTHHTVNPSTTQHHSEKLFPYGRRGTVHPCSFLRPGGELPRIPKRRSSQNTCCKH